MPPQQRAIFHTIHHDRVAVPNIPNDKSPVFREFFIYRVRIRDQLRSIIFVKIIFPVPIYLFHIPQTQQKGRNASTGIRLWSRYRIAQPFPVCEK